MRSTIFSCPETVSQFPLPVKGVSWFASV